MVRPALNPEKLLLRQKASGTAAVKKDFPAGKPGNKKAPVLGEQGLFCFLLE